MSENKDILTAAYVCGVFLSCLFRDGENTSAYILVEGVVGSVRFHPGRLEEIRQTIRGMLSELPDGFKSSGGGGCSFLNACRDRHGNT